MKKRAKEQFVVCVRKENAGDLELHKIYQVLPDKKAAASGYLRILDESGEDYVYPGNYFLPLPLPQAVEDVFLQDK